MDFGISVAQRLLTGHGCIKYDGIVEGFEVYIHNDVTVIQLPTTSRIDYEVLEVIAIDQLGMARWEFDHWLGENERT